MQAVVTTLGATVRCSICSVTIVDVHEFAESLQEHFQASDQFDDHFHSRIVEAVEGSGVEVGGWNHGSLCAYHREILSKED